VKAAHDRAAGERDLWTKLVDGAKGLRFVDAEGSMLLRDVLRILDCDAEWVFTDLVDPAVAEARRALEALR